MNLKLDSKALLKEAGNGGAALGGFVAGHQFFNRIVPGNFRTGMKAVIATLVMFVLGAYISTQSQNNIIKSATLGWNAYAGTKFLNTLTGITPPVAGVDGMGFALPEGIKSVINDLVPNLGSADNFDTSNLQIFGPGVQLPPAVDVDYELLANAAPDLQLPDLVGLDGRKQPIQRSTPARPSAPIPNKFKCVTIDGIGEVEFVA